MEHSQHNFTFGLVDVSSPVLITVVHDGQVLSDFSAGLPARTKDPKATWDFNILKDTNTWRMAENILAQIPSSALYAMLSRKLIDFNRPRGEACQDHADLMQYYDYFYTQIRRIMLKLLKKGHRVLHIDLHGYSIQPEIGDFDVILGTLNRQTMKTEADHIIAEVLRGEGYRVYLPSENRVDGEMYRGGYTVGWVRDECVELPVDTIQVEVHKKHRTPWTKAVGGKMSEALAMAFAGATTK